MKDPHIQLLDKHPHHPTVGDKRLMTIDEVADRLHVSKWMVYTQINSRRLKTVTIGSRRLITPEDLTEYIQVLRREQGASHGR